MAAHTGPTPFLVVDLPTVARCYRALAGAFGSARVFYAVKANPEPRLVRLLVRLGASFDVASRSEVDLCLAAGADPASLSYGNTVKKASDIRYAHARGVRLFVFDSAEELRKLAEHAPGSQVFCRLLASGEGSLWPLSRKFGCAPDMAVELLRAAPALGLDPVGVSFHVGSQQLDPARWDPSIAQAARIFAELESVGVRLRMLNVGGGFATDYLRPVPPIDAYAAAVRASVRRHFRVPPSLVAEPGRYLVAEAGVLRCEVVLISRKHHHDEKRWVYLDIGRYGGLIDTEGEAIHYRLVTAHDDGPGGPVIIAGPTCDSVDILYERAPYRLPLALRPGDHVDILGAGAYTVSSATVGFNGMAPLTAHYIGSEFPSAADADGE
ncbi:ornithine decarboxylase [Marinitenerispora sediminis]|uniref:ornithine decarboxylase n=2 Tax=Marinitenerispora sediminis TaxID=1931232 RepID=A0A368T887_9ACTN|nr:ornithine decarboxylase [Marinitenerispora sediminis]RCV60131.1 ornithine decarboxylase [Marinitenerispora sediminis]RCV60376.1 ornithine decarboxylase [Marinitenerispora sediminis]